jgi:hypothetical protein
MTRVRPTPERAFDRRYRALSYPFRVLAGDPALGRRADRLMAAFRDGSGGGRAVTYRLLSPGRRERRFRVHRAGRCVHRAATPELALEYLLWDVTSQAVQLTREFLVLHAGAVSWAGRGIILPAPPDSGKTTLTAALTRVGFSYLTDEAAPLDPTTGLLYPFPRALWMDAPSIDVVPRLRQDLPQDVLVASRPRYQVAAEELRAGAVGGPCPVRYIVAPAYATGSAVELEPVSRAEAVVSLAQNSFNFATLGRPGVSLLAKVVAGAVCYRLRMGSLEGAVDMVRELVGAADPNPHGERASLI